MTGEVNLSTSRHLQCPARPRRIRRPIRPIQLPDRPRQRLHYSAVQHRTAPHSTARQARPRGAESVGALGALGALAVCFDARPIGHGSTERQPDGGVLTAASWRAAGRACPQPIARAGFRAGLAGVLSLCGPQQMGLRRGLASLAYAP